MRSLLKLALEIGLFAIALLGQAIMQDHVEQ
jgi:hypothetical protein